MIMDCPVVKVLDAPEGLTEYKIRDSHGSRIGYVQLDTSCLDDELMEALHDWQERHAREPLHLMPSSASAAS